mmetsp:Transcript_1117/g.2924  ORF Transcript_1117/g.2924 Transcript_1117/m.2924 type:complete len:105 (-) Transcript_1117:321-635(-)
MPGRRVHAASQVDSSEQLGGHAGRAIAARAHTGLPSRDRRRARAQPSWVGAAQCILRPPWQPPALTRAADEALAPSALAHAKIKMRTGLISRSPDRGRLGGPAR